MALIVDPKACPQNHRCPIVNICPVNAITQNGNGLPVIDEGKCISCLKCTKYCPMMAVKQKS